MHVTAVHIHVLPGDVRSLRGNEKHDHRGDFVGRRHSFFERNLSGDRLELRFRVRKFAEPLLVERRHDLGGNYSVGADAVRQELNRPFARHRQDRALRGNVTRCVSLSGDSGLGTDADDGTARAFQMRQGKVRHVVVMQQIELERAQ